MTKGIISLMKGGAERELSFRELSIPMGFSGVGGCSVPQRLSRSWRKLSYQAMILPGDKGM